MSARVVVDGVPNEAVPFEEFAAAAEPLAALLGVDLGDVVSLTITNGRAIRAKVVIRNKRGRVLRDSWAHLVRSVDFPEGDDA